MHDSHADTSKNAIKALYFKNKVINSDLLYLQFYKTLM